MKRKSSTVFLRRKWNVSQRVKFTNDTNSAARGAWRPPVRITGFYAQAFHDNPYDGHTLPACLHGTRRGIVWHAKEAYVDLGYRGHLYRGKETLVHIVDFRHMKRKTRAVKYWFKRRAAIEPVFGHLKSDNRMSKNYLRGTQGDQINALICACGFNLRKLLAVFFLPYFILRQLRRFIDRLIAQAHYIAPNFAIIPNK